MIKKILYASTMLAGYAFSGEGCNQFSNPIATTLAATSSVYQDPGINKNGMLAGYLNQPCLQNSVFNPVVSQIKDSTEQFFLLVLENNNLIIGISPNNLPNPLIINMPISGNISINGVVYHESSVTIHNITINKSLNDYYFNLEGNVTANGLLIANNVIATITGSVNLLYKKLTFGTAEQYGKILLFLERTTNVTITESLTCDREKNACIVSIEGVLSAKNLAINNILGSVFIKGNSCQMTISENISMINNQSDNDSNPAVLINEGATVQTDGTFTIDIKDDPLQLFDSSAVAIQKVGGGSDLAFSDFAITIGGTAYATYASIPANRIILNGSNQS